MGLVISKCYTKQHQKCRDTKQHQKCRELREKIHVLEEEIREMKRMRDREARAHEENVVCFMSKEEEWKRERRQYKEEGARLRKRLKEEEERIRTLEEEVVVGKGDKEWQRMGTDYLVEQMKEEQARREAAVEKWKQLYLAIKTELDDLIHRTRQGERFCWGNEEDIIEGLQRELKAKEETVEALRSRVAAMEKEGVRREREIDILRQSLRILSNTKKNRARKNLSRSFRS